MRTVSLDVVGEDRSAEHQDQVAPLEAGDDLLAVRRQKACEERVLLGKAVAGREGTHPHGGLVPLGESDDFLPGPISGDRGADDDHRAARGTQHRGGGVHGRSQSSTGTDTKVGPRGGCMAAWKARATAAGTSSARAGSQLHLTYGRGRLVACSEYRNGSNGRIERACCPAVMTSGVWLRYAVNRLPTACPTPMAECRFTNAAVPRDCANPSAMATTT